MNTVLENLSEVAQPYVLMGVGVPGSGKTTVLREVAAQLNVARICPDDIREELTGNPSNQTVNAEAWKIAYTRVEAQLRLGRSAIVDVTHTEAWRRPRTIKMYKEFGAKEVVAAVFAVPRDIAKQRNKQRDRVVPEDVIDRMSSALEASPPNLDEGFDKIIKFNQ